MPMLNHTLALVLHGIFSLAGLCGNGFTLVNIVARRPGSSITRSERLLASVAVANFCLQSVVAVNELYFYLWTEFYFVTHVVIPFLAVLVSLSFSSLWCATWLCVYYCAKIVTYKQLFCTWLKQRFLQVVPWLLLGSVLGSACIGIPLVWDLHRSPIGNNTSRSLGNNSTNAFQFQSRCNCIFHIYLVVSLLAFALLAFAAGSILLSLSRHMRKMAQNADIFRRPCLDAHWSAAKTVMSLLVLYASFYLSLSIIFGDVFSAGGWQYSICILVVAGSPALTSLILILGNPKLKKALLRVILLRKHTAVQVWTRDAHQQK
ncbi:taste receptor type 2 member 40-like [Pleurodeles waltl]|uniref:taste receptor type 2 member 40-like n=1 Tax=Pleurodeles waltl TaxID=8319 RepID=UPI003709B51F